ncbi:MAG TPA: ABC transporter permease subunit [Taishania sp.]|nr:ABC transporter permease subunit [Taishania sp.]HNS43137.1 ABC transporter permease subunit [Taishania sp.]
MKRLLAIEWYKLFYYKSTRIFTLLYFALLVVMGVVLAFIEPTIGGVKLDIVQLGFFKFPAFWQNITYLVAIGKMFLAIILILNITNEYANGTLKQNLIDGLSKKEFILSKLYSTLLLVIVSTIFVLGIALVLGASFSGFSAITVQGMDFILAYFVKLVFFFSFCMFLAFLLRKSALSLLGLVVWWVIEAVLRTIESVSLLNSGKIDDQHPFLLTNYLPLGASSNLIGFPKVKIEGFITGQSIFEYQPVDWSYMLVTCLYAILFGWLSYKLIQKRDL